jgi:UDP-N-acetylmuramoylalanine--D-glutamate ligase
VVGGLGVSGFAAADALVHVGARVTVLDEADSEALQHKAKLLAELDADVRLGPGATGSLPAGVDLVVVTPGMPPRTPLLVDATRRGVPIWGEAELAWRLRSPTGAPWLCVTGSNGKTTTVQMLDAVLRAAGLDSRAAGNVGTPLSQVVMDPSGPEVLAVELSSFQLHWAPSLSPRASAVLNVAPDHLDWYDGSMEAYTRDKGRVYNGTEVACIYNLADPVTERLVREADAAAGCRAVGFGLGVPPVAVRDGLRGFRPDAHRITEVGTVAGVRYVDDSKATNPHAAQASLTAYRDVVWVAGGLAKGASFDELVRAVADRLRGVVLLGRDRAVVAQAVRRHARDVPVIDVGDDETVATSVMDRVVDAAAGLARRGDTVLLAPACASQDMFSDYGARGDAFAAAVRRRAGG